MSEKVNEVIEKHKSSGKFLQVDGIKAFALDYGTGEPVFCIHGVPTSSFLYRKLLKALAAKGFRGVSVDLPGLGLSERPEDFDYSFLTFSSFCKKAVDALEIEKFHLVVHDVGGPIGFALAAQNQDRILTLTILNTWIDVVNFKKPLPMRPFKKPLLGEAELALLTYPTWQVMFNTMGVEDNSGISTEEIDAYIDLLKREDGGKAYLKIMRHFDQSEEFKKLCYQAVQNVPYPIQVIWGGNDPGLIYERYGKEIKEATGLQEIEKLPARHFLMEEKWELIADKIESLINKVRLVIK